MKEFFKTKAGRAITAGLSTAIIWAICTPIFEILFYGSIKEFGLFKFVIEPILIGLFLGIFEYVFDISSKREDRKKGK